MIVKKEFLKDKIEADVYGALNKTKYEIIEKNPKDLLTWNRLTVAFNLLYLKYKDKHPKMAIKLYKERVKATSLGKFTESEEKDSLENFINSFDKIFENIIKNNFDINTTIIPLAKDGSILNGSHRLASCLLLDKTVFCIKTDLNAPIDDWNKLYKRNADIDLLQTAVREFIKYCDNCYIAFLFPSCEDHLNETKKNFKKIVYESEVTLTTNGTYNLLTELYRHMIEWNGKPKSGFHGIKQKECFPSGNYKNKVKVIVFQEESLDDVVVLKNKIRDTCAMGHSSIHITDTKEEAIRISELIFNENGVHFLNYANPYKYHKLNIKNITKILVYQKQNKINLNDIIIDSSMLLSLYGLRKNEDIDFLTTCNIVHPDDGLDCHDSELQYHNVEKNDLIYDSKFYFIYSGIKFLSFHQLYKMKSKRGEEKDLKDCEMMSALISTNKFNKFKAKVRQNIFYFRIKFKKIINLSMVILLYIVVCKSLGV